MIKINSLPPNPHGALTIDPDCLNNNNIGGWMLIGEVKHDYDDWINGFAAVKETQRETLYVCGDFEDEVWASSQEAYDDFITYIQPVAWNYDDL